MGSSALAGGPGPFQGPFSRPRRRPPGEGRGFLSRLAAPALLLLAALLVPPPAQAGPITTLLKGVSIQGAQATFNNSWSQSVMATGDTFAAEGGATIQPFSSSPANPPTSAPATFLHADVELAPSAAQARVTTAAGYTNRAGREDGQGNTPGLTSLSGQPNGLSGLGLQAKPGPELETVSGQVDGLNIGTESLSVFGRVDGIPERQTSVVSWF